MIRLNLGCGTDVRPGWVNIDQYYLRSDLKRLGTVVDMNICHLKYEDNSVDEICARDVLEHISWRQTDEVLKEWHRVLKPGGKIYIQVPNIMGWSLAVVEHKCPEHHAMRHFFGDQDYPGNFHCCAYTIESFSEKLIAAGFKNIEHLSEDRTIPKTNTDTNVHAWARKPL